MRINSIFVLMSCHSQCFYVHCNKGLHDFKVSVVIVHLILCYWVFRVEFNSESVTMSLRQLTKTCSHFLVKYHEDGKLQVRTRGCFQTSDEVSCKFLVCCFHEFIWIFHLCLDWNQSKSLSTVFSFVSALNLYHSASLILFHLSPKLLDWTNAIASLAAKDSVNG